MKTTIVNCPSVKINMGMDLDVINPFSAMAGTILYFKQHEINQNLGVLEIIWLSLHSKRSMLLGKNFLSAHV